MKSGAHTGSTTIIKITALRHFILVLYHFSEDLQ